MGHLRRPRIDVQIGSPFTQQHTASDTHAPSREHKIEEEGSSAFPHKEDCSRSHPPRPDKLWEAPRAGIFNIKECHIFGPKILTKKVILLWTELK